MGLPCGSQGKAPIYYVGDLGLIPGLGRSSGEENANPLQYSCLENPMDGGDTGLVLGSGGSPVGGPGDPLQYSCLENPMDRETWQATVHRVAKSQT